MLHLPPATLVLIACLGAEQPEFRSPVPPLRSAPGALPTAPNTPHRGVFPGIVVVSSEAGARNTVYASRAIAVPRNAVGPAEPPAEEVALGPAPWRTATSDFIDQTYFIDERFDGWSYGVYWNKVTGDWERGWHTNEFGLDADYYR